jgi:large subunit ribosomal protein L1
VHVVVGRKSLDTAKLVENVLAVHHVIMKNKPSDLKGDYIATMVLSPTMGPGVKIDHKKIS